MGRIANDVRAHMDRILAEEGEWTVDGLYYGTPGDAYIQRRRLAEKRAEAERPQRPEPTGFCLCGCGQRTTLNTNVTSPAKGLKKGTPYRYRAGHHPRPLGEEHPSWRGGRTNNGRGYIEVRIEGKNPLEHRVIAERALGRSLPSTCPVHHVNEDGTDNRNTNLVVCQDLAYHKLLHRRMRALAACGHADWRKCWVCKAYDAPANLNIRPRNAKSQRVEHAVCAAEYARWRVQRRASTYTVAT